MGANLDKLLEERWAEHKRLLDGKEWYSAAVRLAEIEKCLEHQRLGKPVKEIWEARIREAESEQDITLALAGAAAATDKLRRLLSTGTRFVYEELMLAITIRVELELLVDFLEKRGAVETIVSEVRVVDETLLEIARSKENGASFSSARAAARKNWGLPLKTRWL